ncbi:MAG TPA: EamA family transporter [archaeon]|nr:EamA family transporter [archaeon]
MIGKNIEFQKGILAIAIGSILLGGVGIFVRLASSSIPAMAQTFGRIFFAFVLITIFNFATGRIKNETFSIEKKDIPFFFLNGIVGFSAMAAAFTLAVLLTSITNTYFLLYTAPIFAAIFGYLFLREKINMHTLTAIIVGFIGLMFLFNPTNLTDNIGGNFFGLLTGICFGSYFVITRFLGKKYSAPTITFWTQLFGSAGLFPLIFLFDKPAAIPYTINLWLPVLAAGIIVFLGYILLNFGLRKVAANTGSVLSLFEPLSSIAYGFIFFSEIPTVTTILGGILIISGILYMTYKQTK